MGPQDGVDYALRALAAMRKTRRDDWHAVFVGGGDCFDEMRALASGSGSTTWSRSPAASPMRTCWRASPTADVALSPDPHNPLNDVSTMNKVMEYMAMGLPIVSFELREARVSADGAARYVPCNDTDAFAAAASALLDDPAEREWRGRIGRKRVASALSWDQSKVQLLAAYAAAIDPAGAASAEPPDHLQEPLAASA